MTLNAVSFTRVTVMPATGTVGAAQKKKTDGMKLYIIINFYVYYVFII